MNALVYVVSLEHFVERKPLIYEEWQLASLLGNSEKHAKQQDFACTAILAKLGVAILCITILYY